MRVIARKGRYQEWLEPDGLLKIKGWARDGLTNLEIAKNMGVSDSTFNEWQRKFPQIPETIKEGRAPVIVDVEDTFYTKKLKGYFIEEEVVEVTKHPNGDKTEHRKKMKRWIPPDTTAIIFYLKCRKPEKYNDRISVAIEDKGNGKLADLIEGLKDDDIHTETERVDETMAEEQAETN